MILLLLFVASIIVIIGKNIEEEYDGVPNDTKSDEKDEADDNSSSTKALLFRLAPKREGIPSDLIKRQN